MKVGFFLLKFPLSSETFVLHQITAFIDLGFEVEIVALQKGDTQNTHAAWTKYNLAARTRWLQDEPTGKVAKLRHRASQTLRGIHRKNTWQALTLKRYGAESRNLILSAICGQMDEIQPCRQNPMVTGRTYGQSGEAAPPRQPDLTRHSS